MRYYEFTHGVAEGKNNDTAISLSKLGKFHPGADTLAEFVPERATAQYALHPDKWESTFYSLTNKDSDKLKYYGPKKISIPPGTLVGDMAIANKFYRAKTSEEKQQYAEAYKASLQPYPVDVSKYRMPELLIPKQGVAEGSLNEYRDQLWSWVQSKFPRTQWPEYVQRDFLYAKAKGMKNQKDLEDFLDEIQQDYGNCKWTLTKIPITLDIFTPKTQRMIQSREGGSSNPFQVPKDAERHAQQSQMIQQKGVSAEPIIVAKLANGYDLIEGWHRTIQHLKAFPQGYTGPAWVCTGATYKSESVKQGVAENFADGRNPQDKGDSKRHGINTKASVSSLRKTAKQGGRKGQLAHWLANMKSGRAKKK